MLLMRFLLVIMGSSLLNAELMRSKLPVTHHFKKLDVSLLRSSLPREKILPGFGPWF